MLATDGLTNLVTNLGTQRDKSTSTGWAVRPSTPEYFEQIYRASAFGRKIIDIPTADMTRRWRAWNAEDEFVEAIEAVEKRFHVQETVAKAHRYGRLFGSSAIIIGINPNRGAPSDVLNVDALQPGDLTNLHVDVYPRLTIRELDTDFASPSFGKPLSYVYQPSVRGSMGGQVIIHASRVIPFAGASLPPFAALATNLWGDSVFVALEDHLNTAGTVAAVIASMLHEAKVDIIHTDLSTVGTDEGEDRIRRRFALAAYLKSINNMLLMGADEKYEQKTLTFAGLPDIHIRMMQELSGAADIPVTRLLGQAPAGLQSTGESDLRNYYDMLSSKQEGELRGPLERLDQVLLANEGIKYPDGAHFYFPSLWQESATQKADNAYKRAQALKLVADTGLVPEVVLSKAAISAMVEDGTYPALDSAMKEFEGTQESGSPGELDNPVEGASEEGDDLIRRNRPLLRVVGDAAPRTLYVHRKVENASEILAWARGQGFTNTLAASDLHVTIASSREPVDWFDVGTAEDKVLVPRGGPRQMERFGDATVLLFSDWSIRWRHESLREAGASWDHPEYQPHLTISYDAGDVDLSQVEPYQGKIVFGPELFEEIKED